jgi:hypothetical protein
MEKKPLEDVAAFLREHRSNESNFEKLYEKLREETAREGNSAKYANELNEAKEKADVYRKAKETTGSAWPEFEGFVSDFEMAVTEALKTAG